MIIPPFFLDKNSITDLFEKFNDIFVNILARSKFFSKCLDKPSARRL